MQRTSVILLNGVGSVGKSSVARALQNLASRPFLHVAMDSFLDMLPEKTFGSPEGIRFRHLPGAVPPSVAVETGPLAARTLEGMRRSVAAMAAQGLDLIVDDVMFGDETEPYRRLLKGHDLRIVGLFAPLEVIEARERARGDREIGLARWQFERVHLGITYDLEIDTALQGPEVCARCIADAFDL